MKPIKLFCIAALAICAVASLASSASALENPEILSTLPAKFDVTSKTSILQSLNEKSKVACTADTATGEFTSVRLGTLTTLDFTGCGSNGLECNTKGDAAGVILVTNADIHLADAEVEKVLVLLLAVILLSPIEFECGGVVTVSVTGTVLGLVDGVKSGVATEKVKLLFHQKAGVQEFTTCKWDAAFCAKGPFSLSANFGKKAEGAAEETEEEVTFLDKTGKPTTVTIDF